MKFPTAGEPTGVPPTKPRKVAVGERYGDLEVIEQAPRTKHGELRWRSRCLRVVDGRVCGKSVVRRSAQLLRSTGVRACRGCAEETLKAARARWGRQGLPR